MVPNTFCSSIVLLLSGMIGVASCFSGIGNNNCVLKTSSTRLHGIAEWRDLPSALDDVNDDYGTSMARRVPVLCLPPDQLVLQGEKKYFQFTTKHQLRLFQKALDCNHGVFALGILIDTDDIENDVVMSKLQLMEIQEYRNMNLDIDFGVFCQAQAVGRASLLSLVEDENNGKSDVSNDEPLMAICEERADHQETHFSLQDANEIAKDVLQQMSKLSNEEASQHMASSEKYYFAAPLHEKEDEDAEENDNDEETRKDRFAQVYLDALESDSSGYLVSKEDQQSPAPPLSWKEIKAISWAAFSSSSMVSEDETMRIHAFDQDRTIDRLKLASYWLSDIVKEVQESNSAI